ncbi:MAG: hypothetical protein IKP28_00360 [Clostridia bacterium]|nr:hypothetical protein [Clostridia bacterium]
MKKGITLIALVITVIVLLILAGVVISMGVSSEGLFTKTNDAVDRWNKKVATENANVTNYLDYYSQYNDTTEEERLIDLFELGTLEVGDYVEYIPSNTDRSVTLTQNQTGVEGTQIYNYDSNTTWRVLGTYGTGENKQIVLTTGSPLKKNTETSTGGQTPGYTDYFLHLAGAESIAWTNDEYVTAGYIDENILDKVCRIYENTNLASQVRSIRAEDINYFLNVEIEDDTIYQTTTTGRHEINDDLIWDYPYNYEYEYKSGDFALENYLKENYPQQFGSLPTKTVGDTVHGGCCYTFEYNATEVVDPESMIFELLFKDTEGDSYDYEYAGPKSYWLASTFFYSYNSATYGTGCVYSTGFVGFGYLPSGDIQFGSDGRYCGNVACVRPIVLLKPEVTNKQVKILKNHAQEPEWGTIPWDGSLYHLTNESGGQLN